MEKLLELLKQYNLDLSQYEQGDSRMPWENIREDLVDIANQIPVAIQEYSALANAARKLSERWETAARELPIIYIADRTQKLTLMDCAAELAALLAETRTE